MNKIICYTVTKNITCDSIEEEREKAAAIKVELDALVSAKEYLVSHNYGTMY